MAEPLQVKVRNKYTKHTFTVQLSDNVKDPAAHLEKHSPELELVTDAPAEKKPVK